MKTLAKIVLPVVVIAAAAFGAWTMIQTRPEVEARPPETVVPVVRVQEVRRQDLQLTVRAQGTVVPRTEMTLAAEVSGRVVWASTSLSAGGFFGEGDVLLRIDPRDYELALARAVAQHAQAGVALQREEAEAAVARKEWKELGSGEASPLTLREPQLAEARAALEAARVAVEQARRDLARSELRAPFAGRVRAKSVDVGQFVNRGQALATLYAVDFAEVHLPLPDEDLAFLDLPLDYRRESESAGPRVVLSAEFAGRTREWAGRVVRTGAEIDPKTRMVPVIVQVEDPYRRRKPGSGTPLAVGMFVEAEIYGRRVKDVVVLSRSHLHGGDQVLVVDGEDRIRFRRVGILRTQGEDVVVASGLEAGERLCVSTLESAVDGMRVRAAADELGSPAGTVEGGGQ